MKPTPDGCHNCASWSGDERKAYADCRNEGTYEKKTPSYHICPLWQAVRRMSADQMMQNSARG